MSDKPLSKRLFESEVPALAFGVACYKVVNFAFVALSFALLQSDSVSLHHLVWYTYKRLVLLSLLIALPAFWGLRKFFRQKPLPVAVGIILLLIALGFNIEKRGGITFELAPGPDWPENEQEDFDT